MLSPASDHSFSTPNWLKPKQRDQVLHISARLVWAIVFSLILHAIVFWGFVLDLLKPDQEAQPQPLSIVLNTPPKAPKVNKPVPPPIEKQRAKPAPPEHVRPPPPKQNPAPKVLHSDHQDTPFKLPTPPVSPPIEPIAPKPPVEDFSSMIKRRQTERYPNEMAARAANEAAAAAERGPSEDERRTQTIMNNLKSGSNGLFQIRRMDAYNATFSFKGWTNDFNAANTHYYEVEARSGEDVRLVMIRRMIAIIREHYTGNFDWYSNRLARSITLSARLEDSAGLEDFLMREFFGTNYKTQDPLRY